MTSNASTPFLAVECNEGGIPMGLWRISWSCDDNGVEFLVMTVSDQERPEVGEWLSVRLRRMGGIIVLNVMCSVEPEVHRVVVERRYCLVCRRWLGVYRRLVRSMRFSKFVLRMLSQAISREPVWPRIQKTESLFEKIDASVG